MERCRHRGANHVVAQRPFEFFEDLPGNALAWSIGDGNILLDMNPAGYGWFVDGTPRESSEYQSTNGTLLAGPSSPAYRRMDLFTVMMHQIGQMLGLRAWRRRTDERHVGGGRATA